MIWLLDLIEAGFDNTPTELNFTRARWEQNLGVLNASAEEIWGRFEGGNPCPEASP